MNTGRKLAAYGLILVALLGGGAALGAVVGPVPVGGSSNFVTPHEENEGHHR